MNDNTTWDAQTRRTVAILLGVLFIFVLYLLRPVWSLLIIASLIAFILAPAISFLRRRLRFPLWLALTVSYLLFVIAVVLIPIIITPALISAFSAIQFDPAAIVPVVREYQIWAITSLEAYRTLHILGTSADLSPIIDPTVEALRTISPSSFVPSFDEVIAYIPTIFETFRVTLEVATGVFGSIISGALAVVLTLLYSIYLSLGANRMIKTAFDRVPKAYQPEIAKLGLRIQQVWNAYLRGQLTLGLIIGVLTWGVGSMIGLPGAFALGVIAGVMEILPSIGPVLAALPALLIALLQGSTYLPVSNTTFFFIVLIVYFLIQQIENNFIVPKVLGDAVELSPLFILIGIVVGFSVGGVLGALIAAPVIATGRELVDYLYAKVLKQDPFPIEEKTLTIQPSLMDRLTIFRRFLDYWQTPTSEKQ